MVDRRHPAPCPRLALRPAPTRRTGVRLGTRQARFRAGNAERGALPTPSARPLCPQASHRGRHHARRGQRHDLSRRCFSRPPTALPAQPGEITTASGTPAQATFCKYAKSQSWRSLARTAAKACAQEIKGLGTRTFSQLTSLTASGRSQSPRTLPADLAEEGPRSEQTRGVSSAHCCSTLLLYSPSRLSNYVSDLWSYGDSNPRPLACHRNAPGFTGCSLPSRGSGSHRSGTGRSLQRPENRGRLRDTVSREFSLSERRSHGHPARCSGPGRDARCRRVASRPTVR
jgi:hypothetical protein